jgi:hypothetical protein
MATTPMFRKAQVTLAGSNGRGRAGWQGVDAISPREAEMAWIVSHPELGETTAAVALILESLGSRRR